MKRWMLCLILGGCMLGQAGCGGDAVAPKAPGAEGPKLPGPDDAGIDRPTTKGTAKK